MARKSMKSKIMALGDGQNDTPMIQNADIGVRIDNAIGMQQEKQADIVISKFDDLVTLMYHHGYNCYSQTSRIVYFYMYKNNILVFVQLWY
jgi:P-type E1-E2 ATPase